MFLFELDQITAIPDTNLVAPILCAVETSNTTTIGIDTINPLFIKQKRAMH